MPSPQPSPEPKSGPGAFPVRVGGTRMIDLALLLLFATFACGTVAFNGGQGTPALDPGCQLKHHRIHPLEIRERLKRPP